MTTNIPLPSRSIVARWLLPGALLATAALALAMASYEALRPAVGVRVAPVVAAARMAPMPSGAATGGPGEAPAPTPRGATAARWVQAPGWIEPDPQLVVASALRDGIVEQVLVLEGDRVEKGAPVAKLESRSAALALAKAKAELARATAERERHVAMVEEARMEEAQLPFQRAAAQARYAAAKDASERADELARSNAMGESEVVRLRQAMLEARAQLEEIDPKARAIAASIRASLAEVDAATLVPQAMVDEAALAYERSTVVAPVAGVVLEVLATPGQGLMAIDSPLSRAIVTLYDPEELRVRADVPLADAAGLAIGQAARVTVEVLPDRVFEAVVSRLVHKADIQKNTVGVKVRILEPSEELKPDMLARVRIEVTDGPMRGHASDDRAMNRGDGSASKSSSTGSASASATTPSRTLVRARAEALVGSGHERRAFVVTGLEHGRGRVVLRQVRVLDDAPVDGWLDVESGLLVGDRVVLDPPATLTDGMFVTIVDGASAPHATEEASHASR